MDEFKLIQKFVRPIDMVSDVVLGKGDDCSIVDYSSTHYLVQTTDCLVEDIHFRTRFMTAQEIAFKSLAVNISDISAMGAKACWCHLTLALPESKNDDWIKDFFTSFNDVLDTQEIKLIGGDLSRSPKEIFINIHLSGLIPKTKIKMREGLGKRSKLLVTGYLGDSSAGLDCLENGNKNFPELVEIHKSPPIETEKALWLSERSEVLGMMDLSDGLTSDLSRIIQGEINIVLDDIPLSQTLKKYCRVKQRDPFSFSLGGGEDYVLLVSCELGKEETLKNDFEKNFGSPLYEVGEVIGKKKNIHYLKEGKEVQLDFKPFSHF